MEGACVQMRVVRECSSCAIDRPSARVDGERYEMELNAEDIVEMI